MCCILGLFDGVFITMIGPVAYDICGPKGAGQAIGFLLAMCSIPLTIGPPVAGFIYDKVGNYTAAFLLAGLPPLVGAGFMMFIRCFPAGEEGKLVFISQINMIILSLQRMWTRRRLYRTMSNP
jgi:MFS family permease